MSSPHDQETVIPVILALISEGQTIRIACKAAGVSERTFREWKAKNKGLATALKKAEADFELVHLKKIGAAEDWKSSAWLLERKFPKRYGKRSFVVEPPKETNTGVLVRVPEPIKDV